MRKRLIIVVTAVAAALLAFGGATYALGGGPGGIWDDNHFAKPGSLDDGKDLLPQTKISLTQAVSTAQAAASGALGQVDLERYRGAIVYMVDIGDREVRVDASSGKVVAITPRD
jgi:uncharacterized membrane protein YkoI